MMMVLLIMVLVIYSGQGEWSNKGGGDDGGD